MEDRIELRTYRKPGAPVLIYLPGLHGDWTLIRSFRNAVSETLQFVEIVYPRTLTWSLEDHASAIESALAEQGINEGWLLAESFGSQIAWPIVARNKFKTAGIILAGGFVRHPFRPGVVTAHLMGWVSSRTVARLFRLYAIFAKIRYRHAPEVLADLHEFVARRTDLDRLASRHRLHLILNNDPCGIARKLNIPVFAITGVLDGIVPWWPVRRWLRRNCASLRDHKIVWSADHTVLATAPRTSARIIQQWVQAV